MAVSIDSNPKHIFVTFTEPPNASTDNFWFLGRDYVLENITVQIPAGHNGLTGLQIAYNGIFILPWNDPNTRLVGNDLVEKFDFNMYISGPLQVQTTNFDLSLSHSWQLRAVVHEPECVQLASGQVGSYLDLSGV